MLKTLTFITTNIFVAPLITCILFPSNELQSADIDNLSNSINVPLYSVSPHRSTEATVDWFSIKTEIAVPTPIYYKANLEKTSSSITLEGAENVIGSTPDQTLVIFIQGATVGFDASYDVTKMINTDPNIPNFFSVISGTTYAAMNALPPLDTAVYTVPMGYMVNSNVQQKISVVNIDNFPPGTAIYLEDVQQSHIQDLTVNPLYVFNILTTDPPTGRFFLKFDLPNIVGVNQTETNAPDVKYYFSDNVLSININDFINRTGVVEIYDVYGKIITDPILVGNGINPIKFNNGAGYYLVKLTFSDGYTWVKKFFVK